MTYEYFTVKGARTLESTNQREIEHGSEPKLYDGTLDITGTTLSQLLKRQSNRTSDENKTHVSYSHN